MLKFDSVFDLILFIIAIIGCISFGTSGAIKAMRSRTDILGIIVLTLLEAFGGGLIRDLVINKYPPKIFWDTEFHYMALTVIIVCIIWFIIAYRKKSAYFIDKHRHDPWIFYVDAIGIAAFCAMGSKTASQYIPETAGPVGAFIYVMVLGVITGAGGGVIRDVFMGRIPSMFKKHFYMTPCIIGCSLYVIVSLIGAGVIISSLTCAFSIIILRILAIKFEWNLPVAKGYDNLIEERESQDNKLRN